MELLLLVWPRSSPVFSIWKGASDTQIPSPTYIQEILARTYQSAVLGGLRTESSVPALCAQSAPATDLHNWNGILQFSLQEITAGLDPSRNTRKKLLTNQKSYDNSETTVGQLSARKNQICFDYICKIDFDLFFRNNFPAIVQRKIVKAESDLSRGILVCRGLRSF